ncbi:MAG: MotA/TolQ/ExbB proton channel family protein [Treponema sp.]|jgi:biopolymer transport protein ExbB|nr:MotA/TolQ/ExbB proton channel family protein [Treponema sp.]
MWPLLVFSLAAFTIICDRIIFFAGHRLKIEELERPLMEALREGRLAESAAALAGSAGRDMGARILSALARHARLDSALLEKALRAEAESCVSSLEAGFTFLAAIGSLAPLTGFLGTVSGMIGAFRSIAEAAEVNPRMVAGGIYEALITTVFGLIIAIVSLSAHSILDSVVDRFAVRTERICSRFITALAERGSGE